MTDCGCWGKCVAVVGSGAALGAWPVTGCGLAADAAVKGRHTGALVDDGRDDDDEG